jgi:5-carboxymethyl-2-hydroxymuconate isomerase
MSALVSGHNRLDGPPGEMINMLKVSGGARQRPRSNTDDGNTGDEEDVMPHVMVEYSANLDKSMDVQGLLNALHQAMIDSGHAPLEGIRTRAMRREHYCVADRNPDNAFVHIIVRMREGRPKEAYQKVADMLMAAAEKSLDATLKKHPMQLALEMHEITQLTLRRDTIRKAEKAA